MTDPEVTCLSCGRRRKCLKSWGAPIHPDNVKRSMRRACPHEGVGPKPCNFQYRAGVDVEGIRQALKAAARGPASESSK